MKNDEIVDLIKYVIYVVFMIMFIWGIGKLFADSISDYDVISPVPNVNCVVVSRMFNTSVDCWKISPRQER